MAIANANPEKHTMTDLLKRARLAVLVCAIPLVSCFSVFAQNDASAQNDAAPQDAPAAKTSFSVVLLPDTQNYSEKYPNTYVAQTLWIRKRQQEDNIKFAIHLGDIVQTSTKGPEWENADRAMRLLDGVVPYSVAPGNHDMQVRTRDSTLYNKYFSASVIRAGLESDAQHMPANDEKNVGLFANEFLPHLLAAVSGNLV